MVRFATGRAIAGGMAAAATVLLAGCSSGESAPPAATTPAPVALPDPSISATVESAFPEGTAIEITIDGQVVTGVLWDTAASASLIAQLPLTLTFADHAGVEKGGHLPQELSMEGMPEGDDPEPNEIGYYAPGANLVLYYGDMGYWPGIARIGEFTSDISLIENQTEDFIATIYVVD
jgi:hypothetical protein